MSKCGVCNREIPMDEACINNIKEDGTVKSYCFSCNPSSIIVKCYKVSNIYCGAKVIWDSLEGAVDDIMTELEEMNSKERAEIDEYGLDSVAKELTVNALSSMSVGEKIHLFNDYFTVEAVQMTRQEFDALPEHNGC